MKKFIPSHLGFILLFCLLSFNELVAQGALKKVPIENQVANSNLIVEGEVMAKQSFWDANHHNIYTTNTVKVYKVFKGETIETIEIITPGGTVGSKAEVVSPSLKLRVGDKGTFMLYNNNIQFSPENNSVNKRFKPYSSVQGFYKYDLGKDIVSNPFNSVRGISDSFYNNIMKLTDKRYVEISPLNLKMKRNSSNQKKNLLAPAITDFNPKTITAGTATVLTITGTGFGTVKGKVGFSDADDGGSSYYDALDTQVLTWGDTEITVEVPSNAGTGTIRVTHDDASTSISGSDLTVSYSELTIENDLASPGTDYAYQIQHIDDDASGGYTWQMFTDFDDDSEEPGAKASFLRALDTWRCESGINWTIGSVTATDVIADDDVNVIRFDNGGELEMGVLGRCTSRYSICYAVGFPELSEVFVYELDIVFDDGTLWETGPAMATGSEYDFESVALHELGHGHQLGHVINDTGAVMHYSLTNGENIRTLTTDDMDGADDIQSRSTTTVVCGQSLMTDYAGVCPPLSVSESELNENISIFPNPSRGEFFIGKSSSVTLERVIIYDISGRMVFEHDISNISNIITINFGKALSKGLYFANVISDLGTITKKIVLE